MRRKPPKKQKLDAEGEDNDLCKDEPLVVHNPPVQEGESEVTVARDCGSNPGLQVGAGK